MRFIGCKSLLIGQIIELIKNRTNDVVTIGDLFSGSGVVSQALKKEGFQVISNDIMYMSYCLVRGMTELNHAPKFKKISFNVFDYLNNISMPDNIDDCFIYQNYSPNEKCNRMYFQNENAIKIDLIRMQIEAWKNKKIISDEEYYYLIACLLSAVPYVANITGVYAAYLKHWDNRTYNKLIVKPLEIIPSDKVCKSYNIDANELVKQCEFDCVYIDTPYNQRQYTPNYHVLETIARYDAPVIHGVSGMRDYEKSLYCSKNKVEFAFKELFCELKSRYAVVSYNNEGLLSTEQMINLFKEFGKVSLIEMSYRRYKSKMSNDTKGLKEQLYFIEMR